MRFVLCVLVGVGLVGCAPEMTEQERLARCISLFQGYDRELVRSISERSFVARVIGTAPGGPSRRSIEENGLRQYNCHTRLSDLPDLETLAEGLQHLDGQGAGQLAVPEYLHAGLFGSNSAATRVAGLFGRLGYKTRIAEAPGLGRRVFVGPVETVEGRRAVEDIARAAGLGTAYTLTRIPWPR